MNLSAPETRPLRPDLLIFGGGIAGLWSLLRARQAGYSVLLAESRALGGVQSIAAQGIIHGGTKYALGGRLSEAARAVGAMPGRWRACLEGRGELDLRAVRLNAAHQYLWSPPSVSARLAGFFGSRMMRGRVTPVAAAERPPPLDRADFRGGLYRLDEPVLDTASLLGELARQAGEACFGYDPDELVVDGARLCLGGRWIEPRRILLAAGAGNADLAGRLGLAGPPMQRRPLQMVMVRGPLPALYLHVLEASANPRLTITSHALDGPERVWYLGGNLAEKGVKRSPAEQIAAARRELTALMPWLEQSGLRWATLAIDRAEAATPDGRRPDDVFLHRQGRVWVTWPTKLALAPRLADQVLEALAEIPPSGDTVALSTGSAPPPARLPWEHCEWS